MLMIVFKHQILVMQAGEAVHKTLPYILMIMAGIIGMVPDGDGDGITHGDGILAGVGMPAGVGILAGDILVEAGGVIPVEIGDTQITGITIMPTMLAEEALDTLTETTLIEPTTTEIVKI
jgi:hypothetical protein